MSEGPYDIEIEQALLGAILLNNEVYAKVASFLRPEHFYDGVHRQIYEGCGAIIQEGRLADFRTVRGLVDSGAGNFDVAGYLVRLAGSAVSVAGADTYGRTVHDLSVRRALLDIADAARADALSANPGEQCGALLERIEAEFATLRAGHTLTGETLSMRDHIQAAVELAGKAYQRQSPAGWPWFLKEVELVLDSRLEPGNLYGLLGASGDGKTSLVLQQCRFLAEQGVPVLFLSGEQTAIQCTWQMHAQRLGLSAKAIKDGTLTEAEFDEMVDDANTLSKLPLMVTTWTDSTVAQLGVKVRAFVKRRGPGLVVIDHAKKIVPDEKHDIMAQQVFQVYAGVKNMMLDTGCAGLLLMQRSSDFLKRRRMRPIRGDCYGGEGTLQNLDACFSLYRAEKWLRERLKVEENNKEVDRLTEEIEKNRGRADLDSLKTRFGEEDRQQRLRWVGRHTRFESLVPEIAAVSPEFGFDDFGRAA